jgi:phosphohistidine phosphatase
MFKSENIILIMRHAKSNPTDYFARDFERPLDARGEEQALEIGQELSSLGITIRRALVSPAHRTLQTFELVTKRLRDAPETFFDQRLYNASCFDTLEVLREHAPDCDSLLLVGHNPSVSELSYKLSKESWEFKPGFLAILRAKKKNLLSSLESDFGFSLERILKPKS